MESQATVKRDTSALRGRDQERGGARLEWVETAVKLSGMDLRLDDPDARIRDLAYLLFLEELPARSTYPGRDP